VSGSAYVIGDVDGNYLINEVAGNWNVCAYGGAFSVLYAITIDEYTCSGLTAWIEVNPLQLL
jgi:hypothetical protein